METKECKVCHKILSLDNFSKDKKMSDGYANKCKDCYSVFRKKYAKKYKGKIDIECLVCGKSFKVMPCYLKRGTGKYCSKECFKNKNNSSPEREAKRNEVIKNTKDISIISVRNVNKYFDNVFKGMKHRCNCKSAVAFKHYGGRGIKCLWNNVREFYADMYESYVKHVEEFGRNNTSIERINNDGNYCKENCKWATRKEQQNNKRKFKRPSKKIN